MIVVILRQEDVEVFEKVIALESWKDGVALKFADEDIRTRPCLSFEVSADNGAFIGRHEVKPRL